MKKGIPLRGKAWRMAKELLGKYSWGRFLIILLCVTVFYCVMYSCFGGYFMTNDDTAMMATVSGFGSGKPSSYNLFLFTPLGILYKWLYIWEPYVSWYTFFHICSSILCISVFISIILQQNSCKNRRLRFCASVLSVFCLTAFFIYPLYFISWTLTAAMYGAAAVMMILSLESSEISKRFIIKYAIAIVFLTLSEIVRADSYTAILPFFIISFSYITFRCRKKWGRRFTVGLILTTAFIISMYPIINKADMKYKENYKESDSFNELNKYRAKFSDFPVLPFDGNEEFYESMGWDRDFYILSREWMYLDRRFNAENLKKIVEASKTDQQETTLKRKIKNTYLLLKGPGKKLGNIMYGSTLAMCFIASGSIILFFLIFKKKRKSIFPLLFVTGINAIGVAEIIYLCYFGRFYYRAFMCAAIPVFCIDGLFCIQALSWLLDRMNHYFLEIALETDAASQTISGKKLCRISSCLIAACLLAGFCSMAYMTIFTVDNEIVKEQKEESVKYFLFQRYCLDNSDKLFIHSGITLNYTPLFFNEEFRGSGNNITFWGGTGTFSKDYYSFFRSFGYSEFYTDNLLDENVYFITDTADIQSSIFLSYMRNAYGNDIQCYYVDTIFEGAYVYKFLRPKTDSSIFSEDLTKDDLYLISDKYNLNNSEFAAYIRAEYGNDAVCNCIKAIDENMYLYKIVRNSGDDINSDAISYDQIYFLSQESDPQKSEEMNYIKENYGDDIDCVLTDKVTDSISVYKFIHK